MNPGRLNIDLELHGQSAFDRGADPLDDPQVIAFLEAHPEELERFAQWRAATLHVGAARTRRRAWPLAAALLALAGAAVVAWGSFAATPAHAGRIAAATLEIERVAPARTVSWSAHRVLVAEPDCFFAITETRSFRP
jgi:hypothetical protein